MPVTLPRGPGTSATRSPTAPSNRSSAGSSLPVSRSGAPPPQQRPGPPGAVGGHGERGALAAGDHAGGAQPQRRHGPPCPPSSHADRRATAPRAARRPARTRRHAPRWPRCARGRQQSAWTQESTDETAPALSPAGHPGRIGRMRHADAPVTGSLDDAVERARADYVAARPRSDALHTPRPCGAAGRQHPHGALPPAVPAADRPRLGRGARGRRRPPLRRPARRVLRRPVRPLAPGDPAGDAVRDRRRPEPQRAHRARGAARRGDVRALRLGGTGPLHQLRHRGQPDGAGRRPRLTPDANGWSACTAATTAAC